MYPYRIGVIGSVHETDENQVRELLERALNGLAGERKMEFIVVVRAGLVAQQARACATGRHWPVLHALELPGDDPIVMYDAIVRIGGGDGDRQQIDRFRRRFRELPSGASLPIVEHDCA